MGRRNCQKNWPKTRLFLDLLKNALKKSASTQTSLNNHDSYTTYVTKLGAGSLKISRYFQIQFVLLRLKLAKIALKLTGSNSCYTTNFSINLFLFL